MGEHHGLRRSGRARGVDERAEIIERQRRQSGVDDLRIDRVTPCDELLPRHHKRIVDAGSLHQHDPANRRDLITNRSNLLPLGFILDQDNDRTGMRNDVLALRWGIGGVDACRHAADGHCGNIHLDPLRSVETKNRHDVAGFNAQCDESSCCSSHVSGVLSPGRSHPIAIGTHVVRGSIRQSLTIGQNLMWNSFCGHGLLPSRRVDRDCSRVGPRRSLRSCRRLPDAGKHEFPVYDGSSTRLRPRQADWFGGPGHAAPCCVNRRSSAPGSRRELEQSTTRRR